ncbi:MAG: hypothetical protein ACI8UO_002888 [Verrucomicrobiales bacterium]|jgi:hypothetical protein
MPDYWTKKFRFFVGAPFGVDDSTVLVRRVLRHQIKVGNRNRSPLSKSKIPASQRQGDEPDRARSGHFHQQPHRLEETASRPEWRISHRHTSSYGSPRMTPELCERGICFSENRVARLMRAEGILARRKRAFRPKTTIQDGEATRRIAPNRLAELDRVDSPGQVLVGDITYVATPQGWLYLGLPHCLSLLRRALRDGFALCSPIVQPHASPQPLN